LRLGAFPLHPQTALSVQDATVSIGCHENQLERINRDGVRTVNSMIFRIALSATVFTKRNCKCKQVKLPH
jgi:hypothetical protein